MAAVFVPAKTNTSEGWHSDASPNFFPA